MGGAMNRRGALEERRKKTSVRAYSVGCALLCVRVQRKQSIVEEYGLPWSALLPMDAVSC